MHYTIQGRGPALIFVHGWAMHGGVWAGMAEELSRDFQTVAVDLRGHGGSRDMGGPFTYEACAGELLELAGRISEEPVTAIGWSMGVSILLACCRLRPEAFSRLVFISGNPSLVARDGYDCGIPEITVRRLYGQVARRYPGGLEAFYKLLLTDSELERFGRDQLYLAAIDPAMAPAREAALESLSCLMREDLRESVPSVARPTLILHGEEDAICAPSAAAYLHGRIAGSRLAMLAGAGHMPFLTRRLEVAAHLREFLESPP